MLIVDVLERGGEGTTDEALLSFEPAVMTEPAAVTGPVDSC